jgi:hypothetical protein
MANLLTNAKRKTSDLLSPARAGPVSVVLGAIVVAALLGVVARSLYDSASDSGGDFERKLGELILQLGVIVVVGAIFNALINWGMNQRAREKERRDKRLDFLKRVRAMHVTIESARTLLDAHRSPKTYSEQSRRLMELRPEVEEISEDLRASPKLFQNQDAIRRGLAGIVAYLNQGREEYVKHHTDVEAGYKRESLETTMTRHGMEWLIDFIDGGDHYQQRYEQNLVASKEAMRLQVYGS